MNQELEASDETDFFPAEDALASLGDEKLQREGRESLDPETAEHLARSLKGAIDAGAPAATRWIYFRSPPWTWESLCGREGWLLTDPETGHQFDYVALLMN